MNVFYEFETSNVWLDNTELKLEYLRQKNDSSYRVKTSKDV